MDNEPASDDAMDDDAVTDTAEDPNPLAHVSDEDPDHDPFTDYPAGPDTQDGDY